MPKLYKLAIASLSTASGLILAMGITPYCVTKIQKRCLAFAGAAAGAIVGIAYNINGGPLLLR
tara:strand:+ start:572 stop:760 length:189 start_codon:yes stop_codon:yes gene_type:complete